MPRRSKRLEKKMSQDGKEAAGFSVPPEKTTSGSSTDSDHDKTIIEQQGENESVTELREEIRSLKLSLEMFINNAASTANYAVPNQPPVDTYQLPSPTTMPQTSSLPAYTTPATQLTTQQKLSIAHYQPNPNLYMPYYPASHTYLPPSVTTTTCMPILSLPTEYMSATSMQSPYMPATSMQSPYMPATSMQSPYMPSTSMPSMSMPSTYTSAKSMPSTPMPAKSLSLPSNYMLPTSQQVNTYSTVPLPSTTGMPMTTINLPPLSQQTLYSMHPYTSTSAPTHTPAVTETQIRNLDYTHGQRFIRKLADLPEFDGQPEQWPRFAVSYKETTQTYVYTQLENLSRLQKALKGEAKIKVEAYLIHPESVDQVMSSLEFHFGRPQLMIRSQISKVRAFPAISGNKIYEIINLSTVVSNLTVFLESAGATPHLNNPTLLEELVNKLPLSKREEWVRYSVQKLGPYPSVRQFSMWLHEVATYVSMATETDVKVADHAINKGGKVKPSFAITTLASQDCVLCSQNHQIYSCSKFRNASTAERWKLVKANRLCFGCLRAGHNSQGCSRRRQCGISECTKTHNRLLHEDTQFKANTNSKGKQMNETRSGGTPTINTLNSIDCPSVATTIDNCLTRKTLFKFLPVQLRGPKGCANIVAFIDDGSRISLLEEEVAQQIGLKGPTSNLSLSWIGGKKSNEISMELNLEICSINENEPSFQIKNVRTISRLQLPKQTLHLAKFMGEFSVLKRTKIYDYVDATPKLLIGLPHMRLVRPHTVINLDDGFSVHQTLLGSILFGSNEESTEATVCVVDRNNFDDLQKQVSEYFALEGFGMRPVRYVMSDEDIRAEKILKSTTLKIGSQYETGLLWKKDNFDYNDTYSIAYKRLLGVEEKMIKSEELAKWYNEKIEEYVSKGYAKKLTSEEAAEENNYTWYLPHFVITNVNKGNKRRLVFDAAAVAGGESLNTRIMKGPSKYQPTPLLSILFKFRQRLIGVCGDIREMFHRVNIRGPDQTAQRFLWRGGNEKIPPNVYVMRAMIFGSASSPCSAQYVKNINAKHFEESDPRAYEAIVKCHYVDDYVDSFDTIEDAISVTKRVVYINKQAGFELRGFVSNSPGLCSSLSDEDNNKTDLKNLCKGEILTEKVLGLFWSPVDDSFCFILKFSRVPEAVLKGSRIPTKSEVLSLTMSIYDPFGFLANIVIRSKLMLQELWRYNLEWNSPIPMDIYKKWYDWYKELQNVQYIKIERCYGPKFTALSTKVELHVFVDASELAFAAVGYWRIVFNDQVDIKFVAGKSKCAPLKPLSIPRLELQAAVLGVRLKEAIVSSHNVKPTTITFWSDSKTVIQWIHADCRMYKQFVSHRIAEILEYSDVKQWRWVPGSSNPADDATRPLYFSGKAETSRWLNGPQFLKSDEVLWPKLPAEVTKDEYKAEIRKKFVVTVSEVEPLIPYDLKSKYYIVLRKLCWVRRAVDVFKSYISSQQAKSIVDYQPYLTPQEIKFSELFLLRKDQGEEFAKEISALKSDSCVPKNSNIYKLNPCLGKDELLRVSGRISNAVCVGPSTKEPIILPKNHVITKLIVKQYHEDFVHQNQESICAGIRTKYWIPSLRQLVRAAKNNCQVCKNRSAVPKPPLMGQLPVDRITPFVRPYTYTGIDYIGPYTVAIGRRCEKRWVALFTCMTTRAIHLELAKDLSTDAVILCIRNFINRRGVPIRIRSDRGTNFVGASKEDFVLDQKKLGDECTQRGIQWVFNTPANPSSGGAWERMVRAVKNVLSFTLKEKTPQVETLNSLLIEAENLVNSRPLTHLPIESIDSEPLTPNHFILGCPNIVQTPAVGEKVCLRKQWHILQQLKQTFWKRWVLEYLPDLVRRTKWYEPVKPIQIGDVVIICDSDEARGEWKRGVVVDISTAADGQVRSAVVKTSVGKFRRPASKLAVLDVGVGESP